MPSAKTDSNRGEALASSSTASAEELAAMQQVNQLLYLHWLGNLGMIDHALHGQLQLNAAHWLAKKRQMCEKL